MKKRKWTVIIFLMVILLSILAWRFRGWQQDSWSRSEMENQTLRNFSQLTIGDRTYEVVLSETPEEIIQGLSGRQAIGAEGMLFILPQKRAMSFWMYQMRFPLDFIWIADGKVGDLHENVPTVPFDTPEQAIPVVVPELVVEMVLEVPAGFIQKQRISEGMRVELARTRTLKSWQE